MNKRRDERDPGVGPALRSRRKALRLSMQEVADASGVPRRSIQQYELGQAEPGWWSLLRLCRCLDIRPNDLLPPGWPESDTPEVREK